MIEYPDVIHLLTSENEVPCQYPDPDIAREAYETQKKSLKLGSIVIHSRAVQEGQLIQHEIVFLTNGDLDLVELKELVGI